MNSFKQLQLTLATIACLGTVMPAASLQAEAPEHIIADVALSAGGMLIGKVVDSVGNPVPNAHVKILADERLLVNTHAAADGTFRIKSMRGGVYELSANGNTSVMRMWAEQTAPPSAADTATLELPGEIVRGQNCTNGACTTLGACDCDECVGAAPWAFLMNPLVIGAIVTAAVAIPLALDDDGNAS